MIVEKQGTTTIITREKATIVEMAKALENSYKELKNDNIIIDLFSLKKISSSDLSEFLLLSNKHRTAKRSFVVVSEALSCEELSDAIVVTPTLQEAHDLIEMEEIERDLEL